MRAIRNRLSSAVLCGGFLVVALSVAHAQAPPPEVWAFTSPDEFDEFDITASVPFAGTAETANAAYTVEVWKYEDTPEQIPPYMMNSAGSNSTATKTWSLTIGPPNGEWSATDGLGESAEAILMVDMEQEDSLRIDFEDQ